MTHPIRFLRRGQTVTLHQVPADRTLLEVLREDLHCSGTKEGCGEGDCGACSVVLGQAVTDEHGRPALSYQAINSCIRMAHSIDGMALWTVEDLALDPLIEKAPGQARHPVQEAMLQAHASQCGFCTPGFVMSLFALYQQGPAGQAVNRCQAQQALSGNLCRCTGYRPILEAAQQMGQLPPATVNAPELLHRLQQLAEQRPARAEAAPAYLAPTSLAELLQARADHPQAQVLAGATDVGLWVTKQLKRFEQVLDVTRAAELQQLQLSQEQLQIGAAVPLETAFTAMRALWPQLQEFTQRFAGLPVRNSGTLGGNVANGSPIGDSMPLLIALGAELVLASQARGTRRLPLETFYTGYRENLLAPDELLIRIDLPRPLNRPGTVEHLRAYKVSKRREDDISAVCLAIALQLRDGRVVAARIGAGGVAATPARASQAEAALLGQLWSAEAASHAGLALQRQFQPISDMRASGAYRQGLLASLMRRFWLESQGHAGVSLDSIHLEICA